MWTPPGDGQRSPVTNRHWRVTKKLTQAWEGCISFITSLAVQGTAATFMIGGGLVFDLLATGTANER